MKLVSLLSKVLIVLFVGASLQDSPLIIESPLTGATLSNSSDLIRTIYKDKTYFLSAIKQNNTEEKYKNITGITVPHHLLASDLIAKTFNKINKNKYKTIIIFSPDHFNKGKTPFSTTEKDFETVFGEIQTDKNFINYLLKNNQLISTSDLFNREHGIHAITPFIKYHFPDSKIIPITIKIDTSKDDLDSLYKIFVQETNEVNKLTDKTNTLIVQSTDFSHYLTEEEANKKDLETIIKIRSEKPDQILLLHQPDNIDSRGSQYMQSVFQKNHFKSKLLFIKSVNSNKYTEEKVEETTSYIIQIYGNSVI